MSVLLSAVGDSLPMAARTVGDATVEDATHDSREVRPGSLFVAIRGARADGHEFVSQVAGSGASAAAVDHEVDVDIPQLIVPDTRAAMAWIARTIHGNPDARLSMVGVTGTNGKTTVVHICEAVWASVGVSAGIVGTLGARYGETPVPLTRTTPESSDLQRLLGTMADAGVEYVAMEVSSHALDLHRADAIRFDAVGFTNLSQDHLDFHHDMESYFASKAKLFTADRAGAAVIDVSSDAGIRMAEVAAMPVTTVSSIGDGDITATGLRASAGGTAFTLTHRDRSVETAIPLVGDFNVSNALVAAGLLIHEGLSIEEIGSGLETLDPIPGRMEALDNTLGFGVVVDYAHTPDAVSTVLSSVRNSVDGRVIAIVGAGGDRDADKRELMGAAASRFSDVTIVTTDNPRSEDPELIAQSVERGAKLDARGSVDMILDREEAIDAAIGMAAPGDMVLVLGKGHEQGQEVDGVVHPFDDRAVAAAAIERRTP